jgi:hypothetical protein
MIPIVRQILSDLILCTSSSAVVSSWMLGREVDLGAVEKHGVDYTKRPAEWLPKACYTKKGQAIYKWRLRFLIVSGVIVAIFIINEYVPKLRKLGAWRP